MDQVCSKELKNYVVGTYKASGRPTLLRITTPDGNMNPEMSNVDIVPNPEVNDKLASFVRWTEISIYVIMFYYIILLNRNLFPVHLIYSARV